MTNSARSQADGTTAVAGIAERPIMQERDPHSHYQPGDSRAEIPDVCRELRSAVESMVRDDEPTTVTHALLATGEPLTLHSISGMINQSVSAVSWTLDVLEEAGLVIRFEENELEKFTLFAPYEVT